MCAELIFNEIMIYERDYDMFGLRRATADARPSGAVAADSTGNGTADATIADDAASNNVQMADGPTDDASHTQPNGGN